MSAKYAERFGFSHIAEWGVRLVKVPIAMLNVEQLLLLGQREDGVGDEHMRVELLTPAQVSAADAADDEALWASVAAYDRRFVGGVRRGRFIRANMCVEGTRSVVSRRQPY